MGTLEDIKNMQKEGKSEQEIVSTLQQGGVPQEEIYNSLAQAKITEAVSDPGAPQPAPGQAPAEAAPPQEAAGTPIPEQAPQGPVTQEAGAPPAEAAPPTEAAPGQPEIYAQAPATAGAMAAGYQQPQYQQQTLSSDTIKEIAEQIISERLSPIKDQLEKTLDLKTTLESKSEYIDERLKKLEKIIDRLQLSVLQKVGDYITNVEDIKREIVETQKSFKSLISKSEKKPPVLKAKPLPEK